MSEGSDQAAPQPAASTQAAFRLGGDPPRVMRLSRKALAIIGAGTCLAIGGALFYALQPPHKKDSAELYNVGSQSRAESLISSPRDYSQIPQLGPPLPGDLGKPILAGQKDREAMPPPIHDTPKRVAGGYDATSVRQKSAQERDAARRSQLFLSRGGQQEGTGASIDGANIAHAGVSPLATPSDMGSMPASAAGQTGKLGFMARASDTRSIASGMIEAAVSPNVVQAGSIIPAALISGIRSDLPGQITAQVTANVYDSPTGRILLIPQGARLIGEYDSQVDVGQSRVLMAWTRLIFPDGRSVPLERQPGTDASGFTGLRDRVDNHWGGVARAALVSTMLGIGAELSSGDDGDLVRALRRGAQDSVNQAGQQIVQRQLAIQPSLTIRPGHPLRVMVTRDLILEPIGER